ncbi:universal stress protein [Kineococcus sp. SYSU DK002]|uniref:universal stress protein n=1 Tax=Kineococcus sp. SYSU DK002 TaxID=3383123 RepID=UPI003D7ED615
MTLLVAYSRTAEGEAALEQGRDLAARLQYPVVVFDLEGRPTGDDRHLTPPHGIAREDERWVGPPASAPAPAEDLLDTAQELDVAMIVVGVRRRSPVGKFLMGSQAQSILLGASVPVVAVKAGGSGR